MHRALRLYEIVESLAKGLDENGTLMLALTCKELSYVALDVLWGEGTINSWEVLQPFVAAGAVEPRPFVSGLTEYLDPPQGFRRLPSASEWKRFLPYADRIKRINWNEMCVEAEVFQVLIHASPRMPLFPTLQHLRYVSQYDDQHKSGFLSCALLFSPSLLSFDIYPQTEVPMSPPPMIVTTRMLCACLSGLAFRSPQLKHLTLPFSLSVGSSTEAGHDQKSTIIKSYIGLFNCLQQLEYLQLSLGDMYFDIIPHLASLPRLKDLILEVEAEGERTEKFEVLAPSPVIEVSSPFPSLEILFINCSRDVNWDRSVFKHVIQLTRCSPLRELDLKWNTNDPSSIQEILEHYASHTKEQQGRLSMLGLNLSFWNGAPASMTIGNLHTLSASAFRGLTHLIITYTHYIKLDDNDMDNLGQWLPNLEMLAIEGEEMGANKPAATVRGVSSLSRRCLGLTELILEAVLGPCEELLLPSRIGPIPALSCWDIGSSTLQQPQETAMTLARLFPMLTSLDSYKSPSEQEVKMVDNFLKKTAKLRLSVTDPRLLESSVLRSHWDVGRGDSE